MEFQQRLSSLRKQKGISQEALAERLNVSRQAISKWENGESSPELSKFIMLCEIFEVTPNFLLGYDESIRQEEAKTEQPNIINKRAGAYRAAMRILVIFMGFILACVSLVVAMLKPHIYNGIGGLYGSLLGNHALYPLIAGIAMMIIGIAMWYIDLGRKK